MWIRSESSGRVWFQGESPLMKSCDGRLNTRNPFFFFVNALTMALGNVNDAPVRLNALVIENVRLSPAVLVERLQMHYSNEFFGQLYRVLGSADFLG